MKHLLALALLSASAPSFAFSSDSDASSVGRHFPAPSSCSGTVGTFGYEGITTFGNVTVYARPYFITSFGNARIAAAMNIHDRSYIGINGFCLAVGKSGARGSTLTIKFESAAAFFDDHDGSLFSASENSFEQYIDTVTCVN